jgi:hypothetical protein
LRKLARNMKIIQKWADERQLEGPWQPGEGESVPWVRESEGTQASQMSSMLSLPMYSMFAMGEKPRRAYLADN